jgi:ElaB/YqjD/DUF883 family membrane-anchored ribosome-binding protein
MTANYDATIGGTPDQAQTKGQNVHRSATGRSFTEQSGKVLDEVQELGRVAADKANDTASTLRERSGEMLESGKEKAKSIKHDFDGVVAAHPMKSVLIALGVGAVIGYSLRRKS